MALDWLHTEQRPDDELLGVIVSMETPLSWERVRPTVDALLISVEAIDTSPCVGLDLLVRTPSITHLEGHHA